MVSETKMDCFQVIVNGKSQQVTARTLAGALIELGYGPAKVATALNGAFIGAPSRSMTLLASGDRIEIVTAREGG